MQKTKLHWKQNNEQGFTFVETLVSLLIISLTAVILYGAFNSSIHAIYSSVSHTITNYQILKTDTVLRREVANICIPYWQKDFTYTTSYNKIELPWYCAKDKWTLSLFISETGNLILETDADSKKTYTLLNGIEDISFKLVTASNNIPFGIKITYTKNDKKYITTVLFSSRPVTGLTDL